MFGILIYFRNVEKPIELTFDSAEDREVLFSLANQAMSSKDIMSLNGPNGFVGIIDSTDVRAILKR